MSPPLLVSFLGDLAAFCRYRSSIPAPPSVSKDSKSGTDAEMEADRGQATDPDVDSEVSEVGVGEAAVAAEGEALFLLDLSVGRDESNGKQWHESRTCPSRGVAWV